MDTNDIVSVVTNFASIPDVKKIHLFSIGNTFSKLFIFNTVILLATFIISGYRSNAIQILIPLVIAYQIRIKPIKSINVLLIVATGALIMFVIGVTRSGAELNMDEYDAMTYLRDFRPANAATIYMINYVDSKGPTWGTNMIFPVLSIIPGLQSIVNVFVNIKDLDPTSSVFFTHEFSSESGFGTNIIGDLYYSFGFLGVLVLMFLYGFFLHRISNSNSNYGIVMLLVFSGNAMFAPRVEFCYIIRAIAWSVIFLFLLQTISNTNTKY